MFDLQSMSREQQRQEKRDARAARIASGLKVCNGCKCDLPLSNFATREKMCKGKRRTVVESRCRPCLSAQQHEQNTSAIRKAKNKAYSRSQKRKEWRKTYRERPDVIASEQKYRKSDAGRLSQKKRKQRYYGGEKWREQQDKQNDVRRERYATDELVRLNICLSATICNMLKDKRQTSKMVYEYTEFKSADELAEHLEPLLQEGMTMKNYGSVWHVDHRIAKCWYTNDIDDIRRCWSKANIAPMFGHENVSKHIKIVDHICNEVGKEHWPIAWNGELPSEGERVKMYREVCMGRRV